MRNRSTGIAVRHPRKQRHLSESGVNIGLGRVESPPFFEFLTLAPPAILRRNRSISIIIHEFNHFCNAYNITFLQHHQEQSENEVDSHSTNIGGSAQRLCINKTLVAHVINPTTSFITPTCTKVVAISSLPYSFQFVTGCS